MHTIPHCNTSASASVSSLSSSQSSLSSIMFGLSRVHQFIICTACTQNSPGNCLPQNTQLTFLSTGVSPPFPVECTIIVLNGSSTGSSCVSASFPPPPLSTTVSRLGPTRRPFCNATMRRLHRPRARHLMCIVPVARRGVAIARRGGQIVATV